jgi:hypothetical protein
MRATFTGSQDADNAIDMDFMGFLMEMPLRDIFNFQLASLPMSPEELVDRLLAQLHQNH